MKLKTLVSILIFAVAVGLMATPTGTFADSGIGGTTGMCGQ
jgi:hypothetical protein